MKKIHLSKGKVALVDDKDYEYLNRWKWYYGSHGYACRTVYIKGSGRKHTKNNHVLMHRVVNGTPEHSITDHINRNKLDNRRSNLRTVDKSMNGINRALQPNNTSGHKGVHWFKRLKLWQAYIDRGGKRTSLGYHRNLSAAVDARKRAEDKA